MVRIYILNIVDEISNMFSLDSLCVIVFDMSNQTLGADIDSTSLSDL